MSLHPRGVAALGPPALVRRDAGVMETEPKPKAKARIRSVVLSRNRESARVGRTVGSLRPRPAIRDTGSALAATPLVQTG
eukprot:9144152-Pyramimonas_sp.AAC.1